MDTLEKQVESDFFSIHNLSIAFGGLTAVDNISFDVAKKSIFSIIGPNGAGKTTIFNCISGLYTPDRHIHIKTGVLSGATFFRRKSPAAREEIKHRERVEQIIDLLDLQSARNQFVGGLPYGTQKLIELGRALALEPELLLLDEPSAGMNTEEKQDQDLIFWIKDIQDVLGVTILLIEHDMKVVMDISDRILAINFGKFITEGGPEEVHKHPEVLKAYLGEDEIIDQTA
ncbi:MAG: ABC transporter ATP-binding protein [Deltaproteobacteria bacterium]|nr:ABC transporter ATP-binding protein [Deltaproteobacteria bacterium]